MVRDGADALPHHEGGSIAGGVLRRFAADRRGNISLENEGLVGEGLPIAQAAKNNGGIVIVQVEEIVDHIVDPKAVRIPGRFPTRRRRR